MKRSTSLLLKRIAIYVSAIIVFFWTALPLYWMILTAFRPEKEIYEGLVIPRQLSIASILAIFGFGEEHITVGSTITPYMINSTYISIIVMIVSTILGVLGGYALARMLFLEKIYCQVCPFSLTFSQQLL